MRIRVFRSSTLGWKTGKSPFTDWLVPVRCITIWLDLKLM